MTPADDRCHVPDAYHRPCLLTLPCPLHGTRD
jgi:hypothetical protein